MMLLDGTKHYALGVLFALLSNIEDVVRQNLQDAKAKVIQMKRSTATQNNATVYPLFLYLVKIVRFPLIIMYYLYIVPPMFIARKLLLYFTLAMKIFVRKSSHGRHIVEHIIALWKIFEAIKSVIESSKLTELVAFCVTTIGEILYAVLWPFGTNPSENDLSLSVDELSELLFYEEIEREENEGVDDYTNPYRRSFRAMHNCIPPNPFKATIRIHKSPMRSTAATGSAFLKTPFLRTATAAEGGYDYSSSGSSAVESEGFSLTSYLEADSPASFPPTPFSRAHVMKRSSERVVSVMFAARDRLRLEAQSVSRDEYSRMVAKEAQTSGQFAVFDPRQTSDGVALTCSNHCAIKVGKGLCCCCRSMVPVRCDAYVYFEFSITVASAQTPTLGIGLSPPDCPLNVMVGSWPRSVGLYTDGQVLIGSRWFQSMNGRRIEAGSTVGMLVYMPRNTTSTSSSSKSRTNTAKTATATTAASTATAQSFLGNILSNFGATTTATITSMGPSETNSAAAVGETVTATTTAPPAPPPPPCPSSVDVLTENKDDNKQQQHSPVEPMSALLQQHLQSQMKDPVNAAAVAAAARTTNGRGSSSSIPVATATAAASTTTTTTAFEVHAAATTASISNTDPAATTVSIVSPSAAASRGGSASVTSGYSRTSGTSSDVSAAGGGVSLPIGRGGAGTNSGLDRGEMIFQYSVNGTPLLHPLEAGETMREIVAMNTPLYPTVSLFSEDTRIWCRFCEADVVYRSREDIGAPPGVRVYCLDGSLLLGEKD